MQPKSALTDKRMILLNFQELFSPELVSSFRHNLHQNLILKDSRTCWKNYNSESRAFLCQVPNRCIATSHVTSTRFVDDEWLKASWQFYLLAQHSICILRAGLNWNYYQAPYKRNDIGAGVIVYLHFKLKFKGLGAWKYEPRPKSYLFNSGAFFE